ncbi:unnamed protein product [Closterium sp. NIES-65]|nr:unnamed protein product [Closterium sp. NIES-65]
MHPIGVGSEVPASSSHCVAWETEVRQPTHEEETRRLTREEEIKYTRAVQDLLRLRRSRERCGAVELCSFSNLQHVVLSAETAYEETRKGEGEREEREREGRGREGMEKEEWDMERRGREGMGKLLDANGGMVVGLVRRYASRRVTVGREEYEKEKRGREGLEKLMGANGGMVVGLARRYASRRVTVRNLIVAGYGGLIEGIKRFDPGRGFRLSTYCYWWIRHAIIQSAVDQSSIIKLPAYMHRQHMLASRRPAPPSTSALPSTSAPPVESKQNRRLTPGSVRSPRSLEGDVGTGESLGSTIPDPAIECSEIRYMQQEVQGALRQAILGLPLLPLVLVLVRVELFVMRVQLLLMCLVWCKLLDPVQRDALSPSPCSCLCPPTSL